RMLALGRVEVVEPAGGGVGKVLGTGFRIGEGRLGNTALRSGCHGVLSFLGGVAGPGLVVRYEGRGTAGRGRVWHGLTPPRDHRSWGTCRSRCASPARRAVGAGEPPRRPWAADHRRRRAPWPGRPRAASPRR